MTKESLRKSLATALSVLLVFSCMAFPKMAEAKDYADNSNNESALQSGGLKSITQGTLTLEDVEDFGGLSCPIYPGNTGYVYVEYLTTNESNNVTASISDASMIAQENKTWSYFCFKVKKVGISSVTISDGSSSITIPIVAYSNCTTGVKSVKKASYNSVSISWKTVAGVTGYEIMRIKTSRDTYEIIDYTRIKTVAGANTGSTIVNAPWNSEFTYIALPYIECKGQKFSGSNYEYLSGKSFSLPSAVLKIDAVNKISDKDLKVKWSADSGASDFAVYRSTQEDRGFKRVASTTSTNWTDKDAKKGITFFYKVKANYPGSGIVESNSFGQLIPKMSAAISRKAKMGQYSGSSYFWNWASSDTVTYYGLGSKVYAASYYKSHLRIYGFNPSLKKTSSKTVKLPKHDAWGGFYHGKDGYNYVAVGWNNPKEKKTKTVIKVFKYNSKWKKVKTATIKGSASNSFIGIYRPFDGGTVSFDMQGNTLYVFTCREMFKSGDGLHHQSNIAFAINTKTMKAKTDNIAYTSHSFNQRVRFKDGSIYLADHGDAFDRGICLRAEGYGSGNKNKASWAKNAFPFKGQTGDNYTGATLGGMEIGATNVITCGTSQPHKYKVAGVKGFGNLKQNVYVIVTNRTTGKSEVKWLTSVHPKKGKQTVGEVRIIKLSDDRFAIMYSITNDKTNKSTMYYVVINGQGKKVLTKVYSKMKFSGGSQPILHNGCIYWTDGVDDGKSGVRIYRIPALA